MVSMNSAHIGLDIPAVFEFSFANRWTSSKAATRRRSAPELRARAVQAVILFASVSSTTA